MKPDDLPSISSPSFYYELLFLIMPDSKVETMRDFYFYFFLFCVFAVHTLLIFFIFDEMAVGDRSSSSHKYFNLPLVNER